ncbi:hypothetical protein B0H12DRAFT_307591 [Mycena haematopus]|nr:hypothetical protein B0H12DRAFT_307591 [Mycena haematopus]
MARGNDRVFLFLVLHGYTLLFLHYQQFLEMSQVRAKTIIQKKSRFIIFLPATLWGF